MIYRHWICCGIPRLLKRPRLFDEISKINRISNTNTTKVQEIAAEPPNPKKEYSNIFYREQK
jgi:hypothetical protein